MVFSEFASAPFEPQASLPENFLQKKLHIKAELLMLWEFLATMKRTLEIAPCARILRLHITHGNSTIRHHAEIPQYDRVCRWCKGYGLIKGIERGLSVFQLILKENDPYLSLVLKKTQCCNPWFMAPKNQFAYVCVRVGLIFLEVYWTTCWSNLGSHLPTSYWSSLGPPNLSTSMGLRPTVTYWGLVSFCWVTLMQTRQNNP